MNEKTGNLMKMITELADIIADMDADQEIYYITISKKGLVTGPQARVHLKNLDGLKRHYPDTQKEYYSEEYIKESRLFLDTVEVFCLFEKEIEVDPELDQREAVANVG